MARLRTPAFGMMTATRAWPLPVNTVAPTISGVAQTGQELTCDGGVWTDVVSVELSFQWLRDGLPIVGAILATYTLVVADEGADISCAVTGTGRGGDVIVITNVIGPIDPILANIVAPVISGTGFIGSELVGTTGDWIITIAFQWRRDGVNIAGATAANYTPAGADLGAMIDLAVTVTDDFDTVVVISNAIGPVIIAPPITHDFTTGLPAEFTCARTGAGRYINDAGLLSVAAVDTARIDHDPVSLAPLGLLVEDATTNLCTRSEEIDDGAWINSSVTIAANDRTGPDGAMSADLLTPGGGTTQTYQSIAVSPNTEYTASWWVFDSEQSGDGDMRIWDNSNGALIMTDVVPLTSAWRRVSYTFTTPVGCTSIRVNLEIKGYKTHWATCVQLETGAVATSYIPTTYGSNSRAADFPSLTVGLGTKDVVITYGNGSAETLYSEVIGDGWWPASLAHSHVKQIQFYSEGAAP